MPEHCRCHCKVLPGSQQPTPAQGAFASLWKTQICSLLSEYRNPHGTVTSVYWLAGRLMLAQGPQHATQGFQPGLVLRSNRFFEVWRSKAWCQDDLTALKKQTAIAGCMSTSTGIISGPVANGEDQPSSSGVISPSLLKNEETETHFSTKTVQSLFFLSFWFCYKSPREHRDCSRGLFVDQYSYYMRK